MFDIDHSAARGMMSPRALIVFKHSSELGNAPAHKLFESVKVQKKVLTDSVRSFDDYEVSIDRGSIPQGVEIKELI